jgi:hypothetical protein
MDFAWLGGGDIAKYFLLRKSLVSKSVKCEAIKKSAVSGSVQKYPRFVEQTQREKQKNSHYF